MTKTYLYCEKGLTTFHHTACATDLRPGMEVYAVDATLSDADIARARLETELENAKRDERRAAERRENIESELGKLRKAQP